ncbi:rickettsia 17 kDa surface antigen family protein [Asticcacaulis biprosthecium C19]|uniref:17 kDa surface antigen n=1 Tax=Asticcacaulis biprosthecium C19 TaxID=715226 RepID=F4QLS1_9CAUL|nr:glycine zipper 2TM domain-containing protein [Asticcacaulis biprosthecium]EGF92340.1 rickettsia 17 kDa surface antigen family protein [Asticcacaulis biprosthecium C19]
MTKVLAKATLIAGAVLALAQPVLAQSVETRPYSEVEAEQRAYEQGRADEASGRTYAQGRSQGHSDARQDVYEDGERADGYCYQRKSRSRTTGTIVGAIAGGLLGNSLSHRWDRGSNTLSGAMIGGMMGRSLGNDSVQCYQDAYYSYDDGYYAPPPAPRGYATVYFTSRPHYGHYNGHRVHRRHW